MNKLRVFQNVKKKRTVSGASLGSPGTVLLLLLFLPYIITFLMGNLWGQEDAEINLLIKEQLCTGRYSVVNKTSLGEETIPLDLYVADRLQRVMGDDYEKETLKAQAILLRTNLLKEEPETTLNGGRILEDEAFLVEDEDYGKINISDECMLAVAETKGMCLVYEDKPVYGAYFKVSNGTTRKAEDVLSDKEYPYLQSIRCERDFLSEEYTDIKTFSMPEFQKLWNQLPEAGMPADMQTEAQSDGAKEEDEHVEASTGAETLEMQLLRDDAGYVLFAYYQGKWVTGEQFRYEFGLASSDFLLQLQKAEVIITTKGNGHGIGLSQFGANEMAKEGKDYLEILSYFFQDTSVTRIE